MRRFRPFAVAMLAVATALIVTSTALAKGEDAIATLDAPLPRDVQPGSEVEIGWTLTIAQDDGAVLPFSAEGVFVRPLLTSGDPVEVVARQDRTGHYVATVTVPSGGLGMVEIGLRATACYPDGQCERADELFTVADATVRAGSGAEAVRPPAGNAGTGVAPAQTAAQTGTSVLTLALVAVAAAAFMAAMLALRGRGRTLASRSTHS